MPAASREVQGRWLRAKVILGRGPGHAAREKSMVHHLQSLQSPTVVVRCARLVETAVLGRNRWTPTKTCAEM
ncbi:hypothetical protein V5799_033354 [Amblyomma americanum]|uniref:Uncharacterized protein n=1 Tax=Amblyomma americanum TaxID=6943 RepID=A0AAQ4DNJ6_AMBAM